MTPTPRSRPAIIFFSSQKLTRKAYRLSTLKFSATSHFPFDKSTACLLYDAQSGAVSLGDLSTFSAPQDDVLIFFLTHHRAYAIFRSAKSNVLSLLYVKLVGRVLAKKLRYLFLFLLIADAMGYSLPPPNIFLKSEAAGCGTPCKTAWMRSHGQAAGCLLDRVGSFSSRVSLLLS